MGEFLSIKVSIANRTYPLRISREEHDRVIEAAENINKRLREFEENYAVKDKQDLLAMCTLQYASEAMGHHKTDKKDNLKEVDESINFLSSLIDDHLANKTSS